MNQYVKIKVSDGSSYIQPVSELANAVQGESEEFTEGRTITLTFIEMTEEEYNNLPEFKGH